MPRRRAGTRHPSLTRPGRPLRPPFPWPLRIPRRPPDAHAAGAQVSQAQDALAVCDHHHPHVLLGVGAQALQEAARVCGAQVQSVGGHPDAVVPAPWVQRAAGGGGGLRTGGGAHGQGGPRRQLSGRKAGGARLRGGRGCTPAAAHFWQASPTVGVYTKGRISCTWCTCGQQRDDRWVAGGGRARHVQDQDQRGAQLDGILKDSCSPASCKTAPGCPCMVGCAGWLVSSPCRTSAGEARLGDRPLPRADRGQLSSPSPSAAARAQSSARKQKLLPKSHLCRARRAR